MARIRRIATQIAAGTLLLAVFGCASNKPEVGVSFDPLTPFPAAATFAWDDHNNKLPRDGRIQQLNLDPVIRNAFGVVMAERNYTLATAGPSHYLASYQLGINTWHGAEGSLSLGSLSITLVERASGRRVWMGFVRAQVEIGLTPEHRAERFRNTLRKLLEDFPPSQQR